ncbi:hypothetical protein AWB64_06028 [Caballeronia sordidicola]|uniref:Uncharacterized protein n=1 Tax=Caballeronia sordidicola TaxID=196367 RepID=A0A158IDI6_CABSO|nr:hypothetical protein AWB64_06028 [Caballeronia sordidicola]
MRESSQQGQRERRQATGVRPVSASKIPYHGGLELINVKEPTGSVIDVMLCHYIKQ